MSEPTDVEKLEQLIALARETGQLFVSPDAYEALKKYPEVMKRLEGIKIEVCSYLEPATLLAIERPKDQVEELLREYRETKLPTPEGPKWELPKYEE